MKKNNSETLKENIPWRTFSIFISSTFSDFQAERDYLKAIVFPKVEEELQKRRIKLEIVDLRWGVNTTSIDQEDEREATVLQVCLDEIKRCRPFFIGLLGDRYGWVPPEKRMKDAITREGINTDIKGKSVTALEIEFGVLTSIEQLDRSVFYFREPLPYDHFNPERAAMFCDMYNQELENGEKQNRRNSLETLKNNITKHFEEKHLKDKVRTYKAEWDKSKEKVVGLEEWGEQVYKDIIKECEEQAKETWDVLPKNWQEQELALLEAFIEQQTSIFCGRKTLLEDIKQHLMNESNEKWGMILTGESGSGKSAIFAMIKNMMDKEHCFVLAHSAGLSPRSKNVYDLLQIWIKQLSEHLGIETEPIEDETQGDIDNKTEQLQPEMKETQQKKPKLEIEKLQEKFRELLFTVAEKQQVVLLIDALDRFESTERAQYMTWLPVIMPDNVRMLCTAITGTEENAIEYHGQLFTKDIDHFTQEEALNMLSMYCRKQHKDLPDDVIKIILNKKRHDGQFSISSPLWLSLAVNVLMALDHDDFEKMRKLDGRGDEVIETYMEDLVDSFPPLPGKLFIELIKKAASIFDDKFTWKSFNYIACSRNGLRESDLEKLVQKSEEINWDALLFANVRRWFRAHLREEGEGQQWNLVHSILRNSISELLEEKENRKFHQNLADYLMRLPAGDDLKITETMYHMMQAWNATQGLDYYISNLTEEEKAGTTREIAEAMIAREDGLKWVDSLLEATEKDSYSTWVLAPLFIFDLDNALQLDGRLQERLKALKLLKEHLEKTDISFFNDPKTGRNYGVLVGKLGDIFQALGQLEEALLYHEDEAKFFVKLFTKNPRIEKLAIDILTSHLNLGDVHQAVGNLKTALKYYEISNKQFDEFLPSILQNEEIKKRMAISYSKLGEIHQALGNMYEALKYYEKRSELNRELYSSNPQDELLRRDLAISYDRLGSYHQAMGHLEEALKCFEDAVELFKGLYESSPRNESYKNGLAISYGRLGSYHQAMGQLEEALKYFDEVVKLFKELYESNPHNESLKNGLAISYGKLGSIHQSMGHMEKALKYFDEVVKLFKELHTSNPNSNLLKKNLVGSYEKLGNINQNLGHLEEALKYFEEYNYLTKELYESNPQNESLKKKRANSYERLGSIHQLMGNMEEALKYFENYNKLSKKLYDSNPQNESYISYLTNSYGALGDVHQSMSHLEEALKYFEKRSILGKELYAINPQNESNKHSLARYFGKLGNIHQLMGHMEEALNFYEKSIQLLSELYESNPKNESQRNYLAISFGRLGEILESMDDFKEALKYYKKSNQLLNESYESNPQNELLKGNLAGSYSKLGKIHQSMGHKEEALKYFEKYNQLSIELYESNPQDVLLNNNLANSYVKLGETHQSMGHIEEALKLFEVEMKLTKDLYDSNPQYELLKNILAMSYERLGDIHQSMGHMEEALKYFDEEVKLFKELYESNQKNINLLEGLGISYYKMAMIHKAKGDNQNGQKNFQEWKKIISLLAKKYPQILKYQEWNSVTFVETKDSNQNSHANTALAYFQPVSYTHLRAHET